MNRLKECLHELGGMKIWPPTHNDPTVKGPQPRILTRRQLEAMEEIRKSEEAEEACAEGQTAASHGAGGAGARH